jgi:hypothetical protein
MIQMNMKNTPSKKYVCNTNSLSMSFIVGGLQEVAKITYASGRLTFVKEKDHSPIFPPWTDCPTIYWRQLTYLFIIAIHSRMFVKFSFNKLL